MIEVLSYILIVGSIVLGLYKSQLFQKFGIPTKTVLVILLFKILCGFILFYIYSTYYPDRKLADIFKYFDDSQVLVRTLYDEPAYFFQILFGLQNESIHSGYFNEMYTWYTTGFGSDSLINDSRAMIKLSAILHILSFGNYHIHSFLFALIGLIGQLYLYLGISKLNHKLGTLTKIIICFLLPSVVFWTSGILKESIVILGIGLFVHALGYYLNHREIKWKSLVVGTLTLCLFKYYLILCIIPALIPFLFRILSINKNILLSFTTLSLIGFPLLIAPSFGFPIDIMNMLAKKHDDFYLLALHMDAGSISYIGKFKPVLSQFLPKIPIAIGNTLFQPFIHLLFQNPSITLIPAIIENLFIIGSGFLLFKRSKSNNTDLKLAILIIAIFIICLYLLTGITTPVIGGMVRYKVPALSLFLFTILSLSDLTYYNRFKIVRNTSLWVRKILFIE